MQNGLLRVVVLSLVASVNVLPAMADTEAEKSALSRYVEQLDKLDLILKEARSHVDHNHRYSIDYQAIHDDIRLIKNGINAYVYPERLLPHHDIPPVKGDYLSESEKVK